MKRRAVPDEPQRDDKGTEISERDFVMARLAAARVLAQSALEAIDEATLLCVHPEDDAKGRKRSDALGGALELVGAATRALEAAEQVLPDIDNEEGEPWDDDDDDE